MRIIKINQFFSILFSKKKLKKNFVIRKGIYTKRMSQVKIYTVSREEALKLMREDEWYDNKRNYTPTSIKNAKIQLGIDTKKRIKYVLCQTMRHPDFICKQNKVIKYRAPMFVNSNWEGAEEHFSECFGRSMVSNHPYGDIIIVV